MIRVKGDWNYDTNLGRFTSKDPIGFNGGQANIYEYAKSNPVGRVDPFGLTMEEVQAAWDYVAQKFNSYVPPSSQMNFVFILNPATTSGTTLSPIRSILLATDYAGTSQSLENILQVVAHEQQHYVDGFWQTLGLSDEAHQAIDSIATNFSNTNLAGFQQYLNTHYPSSCPAGIK